MWFLVPSFGRAVRREMSWIFGTLFAFLSANAPVLDDGSTQRALLDAVRKLFRVVAALLVSVSVLLLLYRGAMSRLGRAPPDDILKYIPDKPLFYLNILATLGVFCLACWLFLRLMGRSSGSPVAFSSVAHVLTRSIAAVLGAQIVSLALPAAALLIYIAARGRDVLGHIDPVLQALNLWGGLVFALSIALPLLSITTLFSRASGTRWLRAGLAVLLAAGSTWAVAAFFDPYYQSLVALSEGR